MLECLLAKMSVALPVMNTTDFYSHLTDVHLWRVCTSQDDKHTHAHTCTSSKLTRRRRLWLNVVTLLLSRVSFSMVVELLDAPTAAAVAPGMLVCDELISLDLLLSRLPVLLVESVLSFCRPTVTHRYTIICTCLATRVKILYTSNTQSLQLLLSKGYTYTQPWSIRACDWH